MKKVKYINGYSHREDELTPYKIYDVIDVDFSSNGNKKILIINDLDEQQWYRTFGAITKMFSFEDVTKEFRDNTINEILDYER